MTVTCQTPRSSTDATHCRWAMGGKQAWQSPEPFGCCGWQMASRPRGSAVIVTRDHISEPGHDWIHASISHTDRMPSYDDLTRLRVAVFGTGWAYLVFAPPSDHVNIHSNALHLWGRADGERALPDFGRFGTI